MRLHLYSRLVNWHHWLQARIRMLVCWAITALVPALPQVTNAVRKGLKIYSLSHQKMHEYSLYPACARIQGDVLLLVGMMVCLTDGIVPYTYCMWWAFLALQGFVFISNTSLPWDPILTRLKAKAVAQGWVTTLDWIIMTRPIRKKSSKWFCPSKDEGASCIKRNSDCLLFKSSWFWKYFSLFVVFHQN